ncbi:RES family NAD+ phosphorylase [Primorskyibacter sp. 2E107]|uniref:RES family NAD+ phosphorylase n=1 Tax=Primorskyibacter sp. 2E107 TaxID=3403458 RepID=UPI003AF716A0
MSKAPRGTTGAAPGPPADLHRRSLPLETFSAGSLRYRVHRSTYSPIFYGPGPGHPPTFRFDCLSGRFGVLYLAPGPDAAMIETLLRNPQRLTVSYSEIKQRSRSILQASRDLRLVKAMGENLSRLGTTAAISTGPYDPCGTWSDALFDHPERPDGILYASRHNPDEPCIALFERADIALAEFETTPLPDLLSEVGALLDRHGKSIFGAP